MLYYILKLIGAAKGDQAKGVILGGPFDKNKNETNI